MTDKYRPGLPEPRMAGEMWSREICDRLDEVIKLLKAQNATLVGDRAKNVQVEITEPAPPKSEEKPAPTATKAVPAKPVASAAKASPAPPANRK